MNGHDDYEGMPIADRKRLLSAFFMIVQHLPVRYHTFAYRKGEFPDAEVLSSRMRRDLVNLLFGNLGYFQEFDRVKVYYDDGQRIVTRSVHDAVEYAISRGRYSTGGAPPEITGSPRSPTSYARSYARWS